MKRVAIYARVSTGDQSTQMQTDELREFARQRGWIVVGTYADEGVSGSVESRPQLDEMMRHVRRGGVDIVAVWKFDRFARSLVHLVKALDEFRSLGVDFFSARDSVDTSTATGRLMFQIIASFAEFERETIRERTCAGLATARRKGKHLGHPFKIAGQQRTAALEYARARKAEKATLAAIVRELGERRLGDWTRGALDAALRAS